MRGFVLPILCVLMLLSAGAAAPPIRYSRQVLPILAENCFACHGHDDAQRKAGLRLDLPQTATRPAKGGVIAIVPGNLAKSELVRRITAKNPDDHMPPPSSGKRLTPSQIELLKQWIAQGARYEAHWGFVAPVRPRMPVVKQQGWAQNPIDNFVLAKLESVGLHPSPQADKITLLRRVYLDLIGLPPTIAQVAAFVKDESPDAYEKVVNQLLANPHYGERWGRHWLDAARYADSDGYEKDKLRFIWAYRDWVIKAFNQNLPYDQFIVDQIAGDELPHRTQDQVIATGFLRNSMLNEEGGTDPEQFRMDAMFDRMDCIGKSILGLTIQCAQCHSHKYDPLSQEEYYRLMAFLNNDNEAESVVYSADDLRKVGTLSRQMREIEGTIKHQDPGWEERMAAWEKSVANDQPQWTVLKIEHIGDMDQRYLPQKDGSVLAQGYAPTKFTVTFRTKVDVSDITAFRLELLTDANLPRGGPGRSVTGGCALSEFAVDVAPADHPEKKRRVKFSGASSDYDPPVRDLEAIFNDRTKVKRTTGPVKFAIDGNANTAWGIDAGPGRRNQDRKAVFDCQKPIGFAGGTILTIHLTQNHGGWNSDDNQNNNLGRFRISVTSAPGKIAADPLPRRVREILAIPRQLRTEKQRERIFTYWRTTVPQWKQFSERIDALWDQWPEGDMTLTLQPRPGGRQTHVLARGDWLKPGKTVAAGVPAFLHQLPKGYAPTRLTLARWLVDRRSPTTARAFVNRMWQEYFGIGIVATPEDFGTQGEFPSHPKLLDWLACEFMDSGWDIKHVQRLIVESATYRQSSRVTPELLERDPYNRLVERGPRFRVEGEIVRDIALAASGLLDPKMGGPSIMPPAPAFLFLPPASYAPFPWIDARGPERYRRSVYVFRRRSTPYPMLQTFDVPNGESSCVRRLRTDTPLQALITLNEPMFIECARALALKALQDGGSTDAQRIDYAFRRVLSRPPSPAESAELLGLLQKERKRFADGGLNPNEMTTGKVQPSAHPPDGILPAQWAAYTAVSRVLLNLDETITKE